jgi:hypothetical protein
MSLENDHLNRVDYITLLFYSNYLQDNGIVVVERLDDDDVGIVSFNVWLTLFTHFRL